MGLDKIAASIKDIKLAAKMSEQYYNEPLMICYSGGKDSDVLTQLCIEAEINCEFSHSHTTADAPETVFHVRERFADLEKRGYKCVIKYPYYQGERVSMWGLIPKKKIPPTRLARYCCKVLKETASSGRMCALGVRASESNQRKTRGAFEVIGKTKKAGLRWNSKDAEEVYASAQVMPEVYDCNLIANMKRNNQTAVNPILDWDEHDVWDYLRSRGVKPNPLYERNYSRVGCIGCPMAGLSRFKEFADYPKYKQMYIRAFERMLEERKRSGLKSEWKNGGEVMHWYLQDGVLPGQLSLFDSDGVV